MNDDQLATAVVAALGDWAVAHQPMGTLTTYRVGGDALVCATPSTIADLHRVSAVAGEFSLPVVVVGRGSNMLVADSGFRGIAVLTVGLGDTITFDSAIDSDGAIDSKRTVTAMAGVALPVLARRTVAAGLTGFEWAVGVPGSVGGAVRMNAGGHGSDMAAALVGAHVVDLHLGRDRWLPSERLGLRFRGSDLADHQVVVSATIRLSAGDVASGEAELTDVVRWRRENQPGGQNAGSVFVNPVPGQVTAGALIDDLGLRGFRIGGATVSPKHANFIQADESATAADVRAVMEHVRDRVYNERGYLLRSEVRLVGFGDERMEESAGVTL